MKAVNSFAFFFNILIVSTVGAQTTKKSLVAEMRLQIDLDSCSSEFYSNQRDHTDQLYNVLEYKGNLIDGICMMIGKPRHSIVINRLPQKMKYISYRINVHNEFEFEQIKKAILSSLEKNYGFSLREPYIYNTFDSWKFVLKDSTKLPQSYASKHLTTHDRKNRVVGKSSVLLTNDTLQVKSGEFKNVLQYAEFVSGYYCAAENFPSVDLNIPLNVFKDITEANKFFEQHGIEIVWTTRDAKVAYLTFFDE